MSQSLEILRVFSTLTLKYVFSKTLPYKTSLSMLRQIERRLQNVPITRNRILRLF